MPLVPAIPIRREAVRVRPDETPSHGGGLSEIALQRLSARRRDRNMPSSSATTIAPERNGDSRGRALDEFQSKLNRGSLAEHNSRDRDRRTDERNGRGYRNDRDARYHQNGGQNGKSWDAAPTPRSMRGQKELDGGSMRVPNRGWDETPRARGPGGWGKVESLKRNLGWDQTPRSSRGVNRGSPNGYEGMDVGGKEWEEEQVRLDRDWYSHDDEGAVVRTFFERLEFSPNLSPSGRGRRAQSVWPMGESRAAKGGGAATEGGEATDGTASSIREYKV